MSQATDLPLHGGDLIAASQRYGIPMDEWVDLSTGINPMAYPITGLSASAFEQLPYEQPAFREAVTRYYGNPHWLAVAGSQQAIQALPSLLPHYPLLAPAIGYQEYADHWQQAGRPLLRYPSLDPVQAHTHIDQHLATGNPCHLLLINPNNPTGLQFKPEDIRQWAAQLQTDCFCIVDEAFIDLEPETSLLNASLPNNIIVLRSFGKFFGLAGLRLGFVFGPSPLLNTLQQQLGLWQVNGPAQKLATLAFNDQVWQGQARACIAQQSAITIACFEPAFKKLSQVKTDHVGLFTSYCMPLNVAQTIYNTLADQGILLRLVWVNHDVALLRVGILGLCDETLARVNEVLARFGA